MNQLAVPADIDSHIVIELFAKVDGTTRGYAVATMPGKKGASKIAHTWLRTNEPAKINMSLSLKSLSLDQLDFAHCVLARFIERVRRADKYEEAA